MGTVQSPLGRGAPRPAQTEARALGDPTRYRIFRYIADAHRSVGVAELTDLLRLNHNAVRQHLAVLKEAALVGEQHERRDRPGRPRLLYRVNPDICGSWGTEGPYELLATLLAEVVRTQASPRQVGQRAGRRRARQIQKGGDAVAALEEELTAGGFHPSSIPHARGCDFVLDRCPFVKVAVTDPATVCQLHLGLAEGAAAELGEVADVHLAAKDPEQAGCRLEVRLRQGALSASDAGADSRRFNQ
ncbi:MAG: helix-turn-helix transcriptional regulator [Acidimicrobiales bacterium]